MPAQRKRVPIAIRLDRELAARVKAFVRDHAGRPLFLSMSSFAEAAFEAHLKTLARQVERGDARVPPSKDGINR